MNKRKIISELETTIEKQGKIIRDQDNKIFDLEKQLHQYEKKFNEICKLKDSMPADCKRGDYCGACEFSEKIYINKGFCTSIAYMCKKGTICPNFCQKENEK